MPASWSFWYEALHPVLLCGVVVVILHVSRRQAIGSPWVYPWIYPWIFPWISTNKSVDMDVAMDGKFHIHGNPGSVSAVFATTVCTCSFDDCVCSSSGNNNRRCRTKQVYWSKVTGSPVGQGWPRRSHLYSSLPARRITLPRRTVSRRYRILLVCGRKHGDSHTWIFYA